MYGGFASFVLVCFVLAWLGYFVCLVMLHFWGGFVRVANSFNLIHLSNVGDVN